MFIGYVKVIVPAESASCEIIFMCRSNRSNTSLSVFSFDIME